MDGFDDERWRRLQKVFEQVNRWSSSGEMSKVMALIEKNQRMFELLKLHDTDAILDRAAKMNSTLDALVEADKRLSFRPGAFEQLGPFLDEAEKTSRLLAQASRPIELPPSTLELLSKAIAATAKLHTEPLASRAADSLTALAERQQEFARKIDTFGDLGLSASTWRLLDEATRRSVAEAVVLRPEVLDWAVVPQLEFYRFAERHLAVAAAGGSERKRKNHLQVVESAAEILTPATEGVTASVSLRIEATSGVAEPAPSGGASGFGSLDEELGALDFDADVDVATLVSLSTFATIARLGAGLVRYTAQLNREAERLGRAVVFKPTTEMTERAARLALRVADNETTFYSVVDDLYFILYEGSGAGARLVQLAEEDPQLGKPALEPLWTMKHLRLAGRHDIGHGKPSDIADKNANVGEAFTALIGVPVPRAKAEWKQAQIQLFRMLFEMLQRIITRRAAAGTAGGSAPAS